MMSGHSLCWCVFDTLIGKTLAYVIPIIQSLQAITPKIKASVHHFSVILFLIFLKQYVLFNFYCTENMLPGHSDFLFIKQKSTVH